MGIFKKKTLAPNDPRRVPKEHRDLILRLFSYCKDAGFNISETETVTQALSLIGRVEKNSFLQVATAVKEIAEMVSELHDGKELLEADLQILGLKMTEVFNKSNLDGIEIQF